MRYGAKRKPPVKRPEPKMMAELQRLWDIRKCFICGRLGECRHREIRVDLACIRAGVIGLAEFRQAEGV